MHVRKLLAMVCRCRHQSPDYECACTIKRPRKPAMPIMPTRGYDDISLGRTTAHHHKRTQVRQAMWAKWLEEAYDNPEEYSPVVRFTPVSQEYVGRKIEVRWQMEDAETKALFLHSFEGTVLEVIPYSTNRTRTFDNMRSCKHPFVLVKWDSEFEFEPCHVPLKESHFQKENLHLGWNLVPNEFVGFLGTSHGLSTDANMA